MNVTHSIWLDDEDQSKLYVNDPTVEVVNSEVPVLNSKKTIELPPLPPTSFFQQTLDEIEYNKRKNEKSSKLKVMFRKLSLHDKAPPKDKPLRRKISTPFDFNHVGHVSHDPIAFDPSMMSNTNIATTNTTTITTNGSLAGPYSPTEALPSPTMSYRSGNNARSSGAFAFNTTLPTTSETCTPTSSRFPTTVVQETPASSRFPRSTSQSTSLSSHIFTRSGSISTLATSVSRSKSRGQSNSNSRLNSWQHSPKEISTSQMTHSHHNSPKQSAKQHQHQNHTHQYSASASSIENLKKFEKEQISKLCSKGYQSNENYPDQPGFTAWGTPDSRNVVRQSWFYDEVNTPSPQQEKKKSSYGSNHYGQMPSAKQFLRRSCSFHDCDHSHGNKNHADIQLFQSQMESLFHGKTEGDYGQMMESIDDYKHFFINSIEEEDRSLISQPSEHALYRCTSTPLIISSTTSSLCDDGNEAEDEYETDEQLSHSSKQGSTSSFSQESSQMTRETEGTLEDSKTSFSKAKFYQNSIETTDLMNNTFNVSDAESTPRQHQVGTLLPSVI